RPRARVRIPLIGVFAVAWILAFMTWVISQRTLDLTTLLQGTIVLAVPLAFGALSGVLSERSGVINIAIEGQLLFGAFGATLVGSITGSVWIGLLAAPIVAMLMGALLAMFAVGYHVQQIIGGVVPHVLAPGPGSRQRLGRSAGRPDRGDAHGGAAGHVRRRVPRPADHRRRRAQRARDRAHLVLLRLRDERQPRALQRSDAPPHAADPAAG